MKVKELKNILRLLPDDADVEINSIYNEAGECKTSPIIKADYRSAYDLLVLTPEQLVTDEDLFSENETKKIYEVSLVCYSDENVPEREANIFVKTDIKLDNTPGYLIKQIPEIQEAMEELGCEGVGTVCEISEQDFADATEDSAELINL